MDAERTLDKIIAQIEADSDLNDDEKNELIRGEEMAFGDHIRQYEHEREELDRQYGF